jgi:hypothetical protein
MLTSDRGPQFSSAVWAAFTKQMGILHTMTTAYHPQSNGLVERLHHRLKEALKDRLAAATWPEHLPWVLLGIRSVPRDDSGISAEELVYGAPLCLTGVIITAPEQPAEYFKQQLQGTISAFSPCCPPPQSSHTPSQHLQTAGFVFVWSPVAAPTLAPAYRGHHEVIQPGNKTFSVMVGGREEVI